MRILNDNNRILHPYLENLKSVAKGMQETLGPKAEIAIHDLSNPESSLVFIVGELTHRELGCSVTDLVFTTIRNENDPKDIINYRSKNKDGRVFKSSTMFIRNEQRNVIGCFCTNYDITELLYAKTCITDFCESQDKNGLVNDYKENFVGDVNDVLKQLIKESKDRIGKPISFMDKEDKLKVIDFLDKRGVFMIKSSVEIIAEDLGVSRYTIYNYLKELGKDF
ncbi:hypothetical protein SH2C18_50000 [Clostridium sediminicola]|uniref:helix-turn-helix transcriptional regulator n=1 Tax=Clostridium sediminicola TaxID=3114879 RepID=UPI0031F23854